MQDDTLLRAHYQYALETPDMPAVNVHAIRAVAHHKASSQMRRAVQFTAAFLALSVSLTIAIAYSPPLQHSISDAVRRFATTGSNQRLTWVHSISLEEAKHDASFPLQPPAGIPAHSHLVELDEVHAHGAIFFWFTYLNRRTGQHFSVTVAPKTALALRFYSQAKPGIAKHHRVAPLLHHRWAGMRTYVWVTKNEIVTVPQNSLTDYEISRMRLAMRGKEL